MGRFRLNRARWAPDLAQLLEPKRDPRWSQNATQEGPKSKTKTKMKKEGFEDRLGAVLGRSWVVLGAVLGPWKRSRHYACRCFVKIHVFEKIRLQEASRGDLGRSWVDLGRPRGVKMRAAEGQKRSYVEMILSSEVEVMLR